VSGERELIRRVIERMERERLSQRQLALVVGVSQGHLSKVLSHRHPATARAARRLEGWLAQGGRRETHDARRMLGIAAERAAGDSAKGRRLLMQMMHIVAQLRRPLRGGDDVLRRSAKRRQKKSSRP